MFQISVAHHRSKQPEQLRAQLLRVAIELIVGEGYESLTLDKVAKRAGVSKGGLQYHFSSKAALMDAVCDALCQMYAPIFDAALAEEAEGPNRVTRAYIRVSFTDLDPLCTKAMLILTLAMPEFARKHGEWLTALMAQDEANVPKSAQILLLCRLAADGFWLATTSKALQFDASTRIALRERLLLLTETT